LRFRASQPAPAGLMMGVEPSGVLVRFQAGRQYVEHIQLSLLAPQVIDQRVLY